MYTAASQQKIYENYVSIFTENNNTFPRQSLSIALSHISRRRKKIFRFSLLRRCHRPTNFNFLVREPRTCWESNERKCIRLEIKTISAQPEHVAIEHQNGKPPKREKNSGRKKKMCTHSRHARESTCRPLDSWWKIVVRHTIKKQNTNQLLPRFLACVPLSVFCVCWKNAIVRLIKR